MSTLPNQHWVKALPDAVRHRKNKVGRRKKLIIFKWHTIYI